MQAKTKQLLIVTKLCNSYEGSPLLQDINFSLESGEILCLLGPSGSGKTTLLRLLAGLENEESGTILFQDIDISLIPPHKRNFGMMFQEYALFPHKNVAQNVAFGLEMQQHTTDEIERRVQKMLTLVGLKGFDDRKIDELSGGEKQRVALARSLAPEPELLLLDEPLGSLDKTLRDRLALEIRTILKSFQVTSIFVTHDQSEAFSVADKVAILHDGILQQFDTPENIYRYPANSSVASFLGFRNLLPGKFDSNSIFQCNSFRLHLGNIPSFPSTDATLLIRPEGATLKEPPGAGSKKWAITGKIIKRQFQGSTYKVTLISDGEELVFELPLDPQVPNIGCSIHLDLSPSSLVLLAR
jgi:ABC-type Fe3+/spermidine/putrescine transport system ATPase subunit